MIPVIILCLKGGIANVIDCFQLTTIHHDGVWNLSIKKVRLQTVYWRVAIPLLVFLFKKPF